MRPTTLSEPAGNRRPRRAKVVNYALPSNADYGISELDKDGPVLYGDDDYTHYSKRYRIDDDYQPDSETSRAQKERQKQKSQRHKRRRICNSDEDEDDEEVKPMGLAVSSPELVPKAFGPTEPAEKPTKETSDDRRIKLIVTKCPMNVSHHVIHPSKFNARQCVACSTKSGEEAVIQAIEFLESGTLPPLHMERGPEAFHDQLCESIKLYDLSQELHIISLEVAVVEQLRGPALIDADTLARFAMNCYDREAGHGVEKESSLGKLVKEGLVCFLPELLASGIAAAMRRAGGPLSDELADVGWARLERLEQQRVTRLMADRELAG